MKIRLFPSYCVEHKTRWGDLTVHGSLLTVRRGCRLTFLYSKHSLDVNSAAEMLQHNTAEAICCSHSKLKSAAEIEKIQWVPLMLHISRLYPPTLPCCPCKQKNMIWLLYHSANNLPIYISVPSHPPTSPQMSDWSAPSWSSALSDSADRSEPAMHRCVWKWTASQQIKNGFFPVKHTAVICGPVYSVCSLYKMVCGGGSWGLLIRWSEHLSLFILLVDHISPYE